MSYTVDKPLLTIREAAAMAGLSVSDVYRRARAGALPGLVAVPGHRQLVRRRVLQAWLDGQDNAPAAPELRVLEASK